MLQFANLSAAGRKIVDSFVSGSIFSLANKKKQLVVSLYALLEDSNAEVLDCLESYSCNLNDSLPNDDIALLKKESKAVIRYCFEKNEPDMGYVPTSDNQPLMIPQSLLDLCGKIIDVDADDEVFLPYSSFAQFAFLNPDCKYDGFEINPETWALTQIYLYAFEISTNIKCSANISDALPEGKLYDLIFSFPPFMTGRDGRKVTDNFYHLATKSLKENGTMCCILPLSFCSASSGWFDLRKILLDYHNSYSAYVISLPRLLYPYSSVETCLFMLCKDGKGKVILVDATNDNFCAQHDAYGAKEFVLKPQSIIEAITTPDERYVWGGTARDLSDNLNLTPSRYLILQQIPSLQGNGSQSLANLIDVVDRERFEVPETGYKFIDVKAMSTNYLRSSIRGTEMETIALPKMTGARVRKIADNQSLLFAFRGKKAFVGKLEDFHDNDTVAVTGQILPFKVKKDSVVSEDYLLRCLLSKDVEQQMLMLNGSISENTQIEDFLSIRILVPSKDEQERLCKDDSRVSLSEADKKLLESAETFRRDIHMKKHAIGQTIFNLNNWWKLLLRANRESNGLLDENAVVGKIQKVSVKDVYGNIQQAIEQLQMQISKFDRGNGLVTENMSLTTFIEGYIEKHKSPIFQYEYDAASHHHSLPVDVEEIYDDKGQIIGMNIGKEVQDVTMENAVFAPEALTIIFDNIISNACCHGFTGREDNPDGNIVRIELTMDGTDYVISISNNGKPVSDDVTEDFVFTYNKSTQNGKSHYGIGGYEVKRLMQEFDGDAEFISQPESTFPVTYKLIFHNTGVVHFDWD